MAEKIEMVEPAQLPATVSREGDARSRALAGWTSRSLISVPTGPSGSRVTVTPNA